MSPGVRTELSPARVGRHDVQLAVLTEPRPGALDPDKDLGGADDLSAKGLVVADHCPTSPTALDERREHLVVRPAVLAHVDTAGRLPSNLHEALNVLTGGPVGTCSSLAAHSNSCLSSSLSEKDNSFAHRNYCYYSILGVKKQLFTP